VKDQPKSNGSTARRFPADHAFVVQLSGEARATHDSFSGRAEHVVTGRATHFETLSELLVFMQRVLASHQSGGGAGER
jgi:hypothetical protein